MHEALHGQEASYNQGNIIISHQGTQHHAQQVDMSEIGDGEVGNDEGKNARPWLI